MEISGVLKNRFELKAAERVTYGVAISIILVNLAMIVFKDALIDWQAYAGMLATTLFLFAGGAFYRMSGRSDQIATALICTSAFMMVTSALSAFNYLLMPLSGDLIDPYLAKWDAMLGFHWPSVMEFAAGYPTISAILKMCYNTTIPQLTVLVVILSLFGITRDLHIMLLTVVITATTIICFWSFFPSSATPNIYPIPKDIEAILAPVVDQRYAEELFDIIKNGPGLITPYEIRGTISFPSYHTTLALIAMAAARNIRYLYPFFLVLNLLILPATIIHGGHYLFDIMAGIALFAFGHYVARKVVLGEKHQIVKSVDEAKTGGKTEAGLA